MFPISIFKRCRANQSFDPMNLTVISIAKVLSGHPVARSIRVHTWWMRNWGFKRDPSFLRVLNIEELDLESKQYAV